MTSLDRLEQIAKIAATVLIPIILAVGGWIIQTTIEHDKQAAADVQASQQRTMEKMRADQTLALEERRVSIEYVKIAKEILTSDKEDVPGELTKWSWQLLNDVSPTKFDPQDLKRLIERKQKFPVPTALTDLGIQIRAFATASPANMAKVRAWLDANASGVPLAFFIRSGRGDLFKKIIADLSIPLDVGDP